MLVSDILYQQSIYRMPCNNMFVAEERVLRLNSSLKGPMNVSQKVNRYEYMDVFRLLTELLRINAFNQWRC
jgi:hypothetical protein